MTKKRFTIIFLIVLTAVALWFCFLIFRPFIGPVLSAAVIAVVFFPVQLRMLRLVRSPSVAALLSTFLVLLIIVIPAILIGAAITKEVTDLYGTIEERTSQSGGWSPFLRDLSQRVTGWLGKYVPISTIDLRGQILSRLQQIGSFLVGEVGMVVGNVTSFLINSVITVFTLFFLFKEGKSMLRRIAAVLPLSSEQVDRLFSGVGNTIIATVYGGLVVAAAQGALTGAALAVLGLPSPVLWGVVAAFFSLLPLVGSAVVWAPAAIYLVATGHWVQGILLVGWGAGVVGSIDNLLRPYLMSGRVRMHTLLIFFSVFGGVRAFGFLGLFIGPVVLAVTISLLSILRDEARVWQTQWRAEPADQTPIQP